MFYFNLHGAKPFWEQNNDQDWVEQVDLLFTNTHGGAWNNTSTSTMWNDGVRAFSNLTRWGDEGIGLSIHAAYQCKTLQQSDGLFWTRMGTVLAGGLKIALGSHDLVYDGFTTDEVGEDFADNIQGSQTFKSAWKNALEDWNADNDVTVVATGASAVDCGNRRDNMKWQNFRSGFSRIRDGQISHWCASNWSNL